MSQLLDAIEIHQAEGRKHAPRERMPVLAVSTAIDQVDHGLRYEYRIKVELGARKIIARPNELERAKRVIRDQIREFVFGEFRGPLSDLERAFFEEDLEAGLEAIRKIREGMGL
jgi:hypothetical protein